MDKEKLTRSIALYNRKTNDAIDSLRRAAKELDEFRGEFDGQRNLSSRLEMSGRILAAAVNHLENLRPRIYMIEEKEESAPPKIKVLAKKAFKANKAK